MFISGLVNAGTSAGPLLASFHVMALQQDAINSGNAKLLEVFVIVAALSLFIVMVVVVALAVAVIKAKNEIMKHVLEVKAKAMPLIEKSHGLVHDLTPEIKGITAKVHEITGKVNVITGHVGEIVVVAKDKVNEFSPTISEANTTFRDALGKAKITFADANDTVQETNHKTRQQIDRVNGMVSSALDATVQFGKAIQHGITAPGREIAGIVGGAKASLESLMHKTNGFGSLLGRVTSMFEQKSTPGAQRPAPRRQPYSGMGATPDTMQNPFGADVKKD